MVNQRLYGVVLVLILCLVVASAAFLTSFHDNDDGEAPSNNLTSLNGSEDLNGTSSQGMYRDDGREESSAEEGFSPYAPDARQLNSPIFNEVSEEIGFDYENIPDRDYVSIDVSTGVYVSEPYDGLYPDVLAVGENGTVLFENEGGNFSRSSVRYNTTFRTALFFDYDNDGYDDLLLLSENRSVFLERDERGYSTADVGFPEDFESPVGATAADYTGNGCLDIFIIQSGDWAERRPAGFNNINVTVGEDNGDGNRLFAGNCRSFEEKTDVAGIKDKTWSLATSFVDLTSNGYPDIHVANDFNNDVIYINQGDGRFERRILGNETNRNGMSSEIADVNRDGLPDIFVSNIYYGGRHVPYTRYGGRVNGNNLLINEGNGTFRYESEKYGVRKGGWGWSAGMEDFDNDGELDLYQTAALWSNQPSFFWIGNGNKFIRVNSSSAGLEHSQSFASAVLDYDTDGRLEIAVANLEDRYDFYENTAQNGGSVQVFLRSSETTSIGAVVEAKTDDEVIRKVNNIQSDYLSQDTRVLHFGLGNSNQTKITVNWNDGATDTFQNVKSGTRVVISKEHGIVTRYDYADRSSG